VRLIETLNLERSLQYLCLEASITFISRPHDVLDQILAPYRLKKPGHFAASAQCPGCNVAAMGS
jgi:hypothetical protein